MEDSVQAAGPRARRAAPGQQRQWPAGEAVPGASAGRFVQPPRGRLQGRRPTGSGAARAPLCRPACHLPPCYALPLAPFRCSSRECSLSHTLREPEAHCSCGQGGGQEPRCCLPPPQPHPGPGPERPDSPPLTGQPLQEGRGSPNPEHHQTLGAGCPSPRPALEEIPVWEQT